MRRLIFSTLITLISLSFTIVGNCADSEVELDRELKGEKFQLVMDAYNSEKVQNTTAQLLAENDKLEFVGIVYVGWDPRGYHDFSAKFKFNETIDCVSQIYLQYRYYGMSLDLSCK